MSPAPNRAILEVIGEGGGRIMTDGTSASSPSLELDDEAKRLALEAAKAGYLKEILTAQAGNLVFFGYA